MMDLLSGLRCGPDKVLFLDDAHQLQEQNFVVMDALSTLDIRSGILLCGDTTLSDKSPKSFR